MRGAAWAREATGLNERGRNPEGRIAAPHWIAPAAFINNIWNQSARLPSLNTSPLSGRQRAGTK